VAQIHPSSSATETGTRPDLSRERVRGELGRAATCPAYPKSERGRSKLSQAKPYPANRPNLISHVPFSCNAVFERGITTTTDPLAEIVKATEDTSFF
jgi:hypothetical protein